MYCISVAQLQLQCEIVWWYACHCSDSLVLWSHESRESIYISAVPLICLNCVAGRLCVTACIQAQALGSSPSLYSGHACVPFLKDPQDACPQM